MERWEVATLNHRRQNISEARDCSEIEAVRPPVDIKTFCHRLAADEADEVVGGGNVPIPFGDFSGVGYLYDSN